MSVSETEKQILELRTRDSHIAVGIIEKMNDDMFDNEERAYFCFIEAFYLMRRKI